MYFVSFFILTFLGTAVDWEVSLQLSSTGPSNILPPSWYFMPLNNDGHMLRHNQTQRYLYGNLPINNLNEWDLDKLGWYKTSKKRGMMMAHQHRKFTNSLFADANNNENQVVAHTFSQIKRALNVKVTNCARNAHSYAVSVTSHKIIL